MAAKTWQRASVPEDKPFEPWVREFEPLDRSEWGPRETKAGLALHKALETEGLLEPNAAMLLEHIPGTAIYMSYTVSGSAVCQYSVFAKIETNGSSHLLTPPFGTSCYPMHGALGLVLGQPVYLETGTASRTVEDPVAQIAPWMAGHWGRACQLTVEMHYQWVPEKKFCRDPRVCEAVHGAAADVATKYSGYREGPDRRILVIGPNQQVPDFMYPSSDYVVDVASRLDVVRNGWHVLGGANDSPPAQPPPTSTYSVFQSEFPSDDKYYGFSNEGFVLFSWTIEGTRYLGAVGHSGVGWKEEPSILLAVYAAPGPHDRAFVPVAGFFLDRIKKDLKGTVVREGESAQ